MKERIYTIPLTESLDAETECPFCFLEKKIEKEQIEYALGPAMMEPDYRLISNEKGFCQKHMEALFNSRRALPFSLVHDTRIDEVIKSLEDVLKKPEKKKTQVLMNTLKGHTSGCIVCDRVESTIKKFINTFWYLYKKEPDFKNRILNGKGFCIHHFEDIIKESNQAGLKKNEYVNELLELELKNLKRIKENVHDFTKQFDYRNEGKSNEDIHDAHILCAEKLSKYCER